jgi:hypothetical protein
MFTKIGITDLVLIAIFVLLCVALFLAIRYFSMFDTYKVEADAEIYIKLEEIIGVMRLQFNEIADFRKDFVLTFDSELRKKLTEVMQIGEKPDNLMKKYNPKTGKDELVPIDKGW